MHVIDENNYKHKIKSKRFYKNIFSLHPFNRNPYAIDNIKTYLLNQDSTLELVSTEYKNCNQKLAFVCKLHRDKGVQYKTLDCVVNSGSGCVFCKAEKTGERCRVKTEIIISRCYELGLEYVGRYLKNQNTWVNFVCPHHSNKGVQSISWGHLKNCAVGCAYCIGRHKTTDDFKKEMAQINPDVEIIGEYGGSEKKVLCRCKICGHEWSPIGRSLKNKQGCPHCSMSKGEKKIYSYLNAKSISYVMQKTFDGCKYDQKLKFDFYLPSCNTCIEYDGIQHYEPVDFANKGEEWAKNIFDQTKIKDKIKDDYCKQNGIDILRIPYWEYENIDSILDSRINL